MESLQKRVATDSGVIVLFSVRAVWLALLALGVNYAEGQDKILNIENNVTVDTAPETYSLS